MPEARAGDLSRLVLRAVDAEATSPISTVSPEFVPVIVVQDLNRRLARHGLAAGFAIGVAAVRSEVRIDIPNGRLSERDVVHVKRVFVRCFTTGTNAGVEADIEMFLGQQTAAGALSQADTAYGDRKYGDISPILIGRKTGGAASVGGVNVFGAEYRGAANVASELPVHVILRAADISPSPRGANSMTIRPTVDNMGISAAFEWEVIPDVQ